MIGPKPTKAGGGEMLFCQAQTWPYAMWPLLPELSIHGFGRQAVVIIMPPGFAGLL